MKDFKLSFYTRESKRKDEQKVKIYGRITMDTARLDFSANRQVEQQHWDNKRNLIKGKSIAAIELTKYLSTIEESFYKIERELIEKSIPVTPFNLLQYYKDQKSGKVKSNEKTLLQLFDIHVKELLELFHIGSIVRPTVTRYQTTQKYLQEFLIKRGKADIYLSDLDFAFIRDFDHYIRVEKKCANNTTVKYIKNIRKVIRIAIDYNWMTKDPSKPYKEKTKTVERDYLTIEELRSLEDLQLDIERLEKVRKFFLFSCYTGLAYIDLFSLKIHNIERDANGDAWIIKPRKKTGVVSRIYLLPAAEEILEHFSTHPLAIKNDTLFPPISNQRLNGYLKELSDRTGITKNLTFHVARHTFATTVTLANGVSLEAVSDQLGHTNIRQTQHYARMVAKRVGNEMAQLKNLFR